MITKLILRNFKSIREQTYEFTKFDLLMGTNNCGKSTILQALAIWQFCVDEFRRSKRTGKTGTQVILPNFTALPLPEFNLLWREKYDRRYPIRDGKKAQEYILIEIEVYWRSAGETENKFGVQLRYTTPQTIYAIPIQGWGEFRKLEGQLPVVAYVPTFSGLEPFEQWKDDGVLRQQVGKAQPGGVLRNLLLRVCPSPKKDANGKSPKNHDFPDSWKELKDKIKQWFSVDLKEPEYESGKDINIQCEYKQGQHKYDIIACGSGFHQALTLLAFLFGYKPTTILLDEPDAHLHVNLQREILDYFKSKSIETGTQFIIATHAEEFARGVSSGQIVSLLGPEPVRVESTPDMLRAMADVTNVELTKLRNSPAVLYVEGESDERILRAWAKSCDAEEDIGKVCFRVMRGGNKEKMKQDADDHFKAVCQIIKNAKRLMLFDYDTEETAFHPPPDNPTLFEWRRKNIQNYLLAPDAWKRAVAKETGLAQDDLFLSPLRQAIDAFFAAQNLALPPGQCWRTVSANIFEIVDGKGILFEKADSLFQKLSDSSNPLIVKLPPETVAQNMTADEIHEDVHLFFQKLREVVTIN